MSASLQTTNYKLPYFGENDNTDWSAYNESMQKIDTQLFANAGSAASATAQIEAVQANVTTLNNTVQAQTNKISNLETNVTTAQSTINLINQTDLEQNQRIAALEEKPSGNTPTPITITPINVGQISFSNSGSTDISNAEAVDFTEYRATIEEGYTDDTVANPKGYKMKIYAQVTLLPNSGNLDAGGPHVACLMLDNTYNGKRWTIQETKAQATVQFNNMTFNTSQLPATLPWAKTHGMIISRNDQLILCAVMQTDTALDNKITSAILEGEFTIYFEISNN